MDYKLNLYLPAEVEIGGQKYKLRPLNRSRFRQLREYQKAADATTDGFERMELLYDQVHLAVDAPAEVLDELDVGQLNELMEIVGKSMLREKPGAETPSETEEKNVPKPGDVTAP